MSIYLDYNASAPIDERVLNVMFDVYRNDIGNADSRTHKHGESARKIVETARKQVASLLKVDSNEVFFTSGATESNNIAIQGLQDYANKTGKKHIITSAIEHKAVLETIKAMQLKGFDVDIISPDKSGRIDTKQVLSLIREDTLLVSIMHVNNESGIIQPVHELGEVLSKREVFFHIDATQSCGKLIKEIQELKYDMLSFSAHKLQGPQGIGCLILKRTNYKLPPVKNVYYGGQQEHGIRPGTIPVALVAGCGKACEIAGLVGIKNKESCNKIKQEILRILRESGIKYKFNGDQKYCISSTLNLCIPGVVSEALMISTKQFCSISNGSACTSKSYEPSYVLKAMGIKEEEIECSIRISWGPDTLFEELREEFTKLIDTAKQIQI